jgi:hypothetical protein
VGVGNGLSVGVDDWASVAGVEDWQAAITTPNPSTALSKQNRFNVFILFVTPWML